jgi:DMSO/TMAO reductase YedYZ heme-binding membrane subunit
MKGWRIVAVAALAQLAIFAGVVEVYGTDEEGIRTLVRATARVSFLFFLPVYLASSARRLWPSTATRWALANRRYLGVSFFVAHALHLDSIWMLSLLLGDSFAMGAQSLYGGGLAYVFAAAMAATSSNRAVARLGPRRWSALHRAGIHYIWFIWAFTWLPATLASPLYALFTALTLGAAGVRFAAWRSRAANAQVAAAAATSGAICWKASPPRCRAA